MSNATTSERQADGDTQRERNHAHQPDLRAGDERGDHWLSFYGVESLNLVYPEIAQFVPTSVNVTLFDVVSPISPPSVAQNALARGIYKQTS